jgi:hypothetical protein
MGSVIEEYQLRGHKGVIYTKIEEQNFDSVDETNSYLETRSRCIGSTKKFRTMIWGTQCEPDWILKNVYIKHE